MTALGAFEEAFHTSLDALGWPAERRPVEVLWRHFELLREANRSFNLTRITDPRDAAVRHYADSFALPLWWDRCVSEAEPGRGRSLLVLDVGTGGGFPAVPAAVSRPAWAIAAIDKTAKKVRFVEYCIKELGLPNLLAVHGRLPQWRPELLFDLAVFRAVATVAESLRSVQGVIRPGGWVVCYKTASTPGAELAEAYRWAEAHGWQAAAPFEYALQTVEHRGPRRLIAFRREAPSPKSPSSG
jgi:16S rRNA (guanine527-N7)-methyltransferase